MRTFHDFISDQRRRQRRCSIRTIGQLYSLRTNWWRKHQEQTCAPDAYDNAHEPVESLDHLKACIRERGYVPNPDGWSLRELLQGATVMWEEYQTVSHGAPTRKAGRWVARDDELRRQDDP